MDPKRIAEVIEASKADVVCLQELDAHRARSGGIHQAEVIASALSMHCHFFPAIRVLSEEYGDAILSRHPMKLVRSGLLPKSPGAMEPRGAIWVEIQAEGIAWQVINTHLGLGHLERRVQGRALAEWIELALAKTPVILCGDFNSRSASTVHKIIGRGLRDAQLAVNGIQRRTFATWLPWVCLDYIYVSPDVHVMSTEVLQTPLTKISSDHFPLLADLVG